MRQCSWGMALARDYECLARNLPGWRGVLPTQHWLTREKLDSKKTGTERPFDSWQPTDQTNNQ